MSTPHNLITAATLVNVDRAVRALLTDHSPLAVATMNKIPGFTDAVEAVTHYADLQEALTQRPPVATFADRIAELHRNLQNGHLTPQDVEAAAASLALIEPTQQMERSITESLRVGLTSKLSDLVLNGQDVMRRHLHQELMDLLDTLSAMGSMHQLSTAEAAIDAGRSDDYRSLTTAAKTYAAIRSVQRRIDSLGGSGVDRLGGNYPVAATMKGAAEYWDGFARWAERNYGDNRAPVVDSSTGSAGWSAHPDPTPWPPLQPVDEHAIAWLRFFLDHSDVQAWVPTHSELDTERAHLAGVLRQAHLAEHAKMTKPLRPGSRPGGQWSAPASAFTGQSPTLNRAGT